MVRSGAIVVGMPVIGLIVVVRVCDVGAVGIGSGVCTSSELPVTDHS